MPRAMDIRRPYYREGIPVRADLDRYDDDGEPLRLEGTVIDRACRALAGAVVVDSARRPPRQGHDSPGAPLLRSGRRRRQGRFAFTMPMPGRHQRRHLPPGALPREGLCRGGRAADHANSISRAIPTTRPSSRPTAACRWCMARRLRPGGVGLPPRGERSREFGQLSRHKPATPPIVPGQEGLA